MSYDRKIEHNLLAFSANIWQNLRMQYKIPIQIENEDTIVFGLSLRQLGIIIVWVVIAFGLFNKLESTFGRVPVLIFCVFIMLIFFIIAKFNSHEMTFLPFCLNFLRYKINGNGYNGQGRIWMKWIDSYSPLQIWYVKPIFDTETHKKHEKHTDKFAENLKKI